METPAKTPPGGDCSAAGAAEDRRGFFAQAATLVLGGVALLVPAVTGIVAFLNPLLRQRSRAARFFRLTSLEALPEDGTPRKFPVIADRTDAWNRFAKEPIGAVFLRRTGDREEPVKAFQAVCPHLGCHIQFQASPGGERFFCPCHGASFDAKSGKRLEARSESPRDMDTLEVDPTRLRNGEVWVKFQKFQTGTSEKIEQA